LLSGCKTISGNTGRQVDREPNQQQDISGIPTAELHRHLEAGLSPETIAILGQKNRITQIKSSKGEILPVDPQDPDSIRTYYKNLIPGLTTPDGFMKFLASFAVPLSVIKSLEDLSEATRRQVLEQAAKGCLHLELRGSPYTYQSSIKDNPPYEEIIGAIRSGMGKAYDETEASASYIACFSRQKAGQFGKEVVDTVVKTNTADSPIGIDIAGVEPGFPPSKFKDILAPAIEAKVPMTIHAGEQSPPPNFKETPASFIREAIDLGAKRIGHGTSLISDMELMEYCRQNGIHIEACPESNQALGYMPIASHPLGKFLRYGLSASVSTDDPLMFNDNSVRELLKNNMEALKITPDDVAQMTRHAINAAFVSEKRREELTRKFNSLCPRK
jgi:adenosine deaminase